MGNHMVKRGPPNKFSQEIADQICDLMAAGSDMIEACDTLKLNRSTVYRWMTQFPEFEAQCARARETLTDVRLKMIRDKITTAQEKGIDPALLRIQVSHEQWLAEKIAPRYQQRQRTELTGKDGGPVKIESIDLSHMSDEELDLLDIALNPPADDEDDE
jgi:hypothetical protein